jgi:predicted SnoaL-like aldol condensation-catalyzing enzyme
MTDRGEAETLVRRLQECFNTRRFEQAADLHAPGFHSHPLGAGVEAGLAAWRMLTGTYPRMRVDAVDVLVDGDRAAVRSVVRGVPGATPELYEIFRFEDGRFAEMWGAAAGFPATAGPQELAGRPS